MGLIHEEQDIPAIAAGATIIAAVGRDRDLNFLCKREMSIHANELIGEEDTNSLHSRVDFER